MKTSRMLPALIAVLGSTMAVAMPAAAEEPVPVTREAPKYPKAAETRNIEGRVVLAFDVEESGNVSNVRVVESDRPTMFDTAAVDAVSKWQYEAGAPGEDVMIAIDFKL